MPIQFGPCEIDLEARTLRRKGTVVHLTPKAFDLLALLVQSRPRVVTKDKITELLWPDTFVSEANLSNLVAEVRRGLGEDSRKPKLIRTVHRIGYAFQGEEAAAWTAPPRWEVVTAGGTVGLSLGEHIIGRASECPVALGDPSVSRRHARVVVSPETVTIEDLKSRNGTFVEGKKIDAPVVVRNDDEIHVGAVRLVFREVRPDASTAGLKPVEGGRATGRTARSRS